MLVMHASDSLTCNFYNVFYFMPVMHALDSPTCTIFIIIILLVIFLSHHILWKGEGGLRAGYACVRQSDLHSLQCVLFHARYARVGQSNLHFFYYYLTGSFQSHHKAKDFNLF